MLPYKYIANFQQSIALNQSVDETFISSASLDSLKSLAPDNIDFDKNIDLIGVAFNAAVANTFNKNGDGIDTETAIAIKDYFIHKPTNIEHQKKKIVGHIVGSSLSEYGSNDIISEEEAMQKSDPFNIALSAVIYKSANPDFANLVESSADPESEMYNKVSASWEIGFNKYKIAVGSKNLNEAKILPDELTEEYSRFLKAYGGNGRTEEGEEVYRLIHGDIYPLGIGFTGNPAADVSGITLLDKKDEEEEEDSISLSYDKIEIKNKILSEKISHLQKDDVILNKNKKPITTMEKQILEQITDMLQAQASQKELSEEAIANITKVFHDAIIEKNDKWNAEKEDLLKEKEDLQKASEATAQEIEDLKVKLAEVNEELSTIQAETEARKQSDIFNQRMSEVDDLFELEDEDRSVLASELQKIDSTEEAFAEYREKLQVIWKHKTKAFKAEQDKLIADRIEEEVQKRLSSLASSEASEASEEVTEAEQENAEEVIENAEANKENLSNNNNESVEEELSLKEKFKQAFSKESITINY